jgi:RNA polymerase sigma-70 factor (ECF subfamily)
MTLTDNLSDSELLRSLQTGNEEALATLYRRRQGSIYRFALQMSGSHALAEDVTQEVFMVLIRGNAEYDPSRGSVNAFMLGIARNHVLRRLHHQQALVSFEADSGETQVNQIVAKDGPLEELSRSEAIESVRRAVLTLPGHYREVVVLCELQEMSYAEAAVILGCAIGTVRSRLHRARSLLIEKLRPASKENTAEAEARSARCFA